MQNPMSRTAVAVLLLMTGIVAACAPGKLPSTKVGKPYDVNGKTYYPAYDTAYDRIGEASWYGPGFHGNSTASGETYDQNDLTAAHPTLPMPSLVRVTNLGNGKSAIIRINDRGPFAANRIIDLSKKSAQALGIRGIAQVRVQYLEPETQDYLEMVKANKGRIIHMAEYNRRAAEFKVAQAVPATDVSVRDVVAPLPQKQKTPSGTLLMREAMAEEPVKEMEAFAEEAELPPPPAPAAAAPSAAPPAERLPGAYAIQLGSFASEENARKLAKKLTGIAEPSVEQVEVQGKNWWRVRIDGLEDRYSADSLAAAIRAAGVPEARIVRP